jgi:hypothetical protein
VSILCRYGVPRYSAEQSMPRFRLVICSSLTLKASSTHFGLCFRFYGLYRSELPVHVWFEAQAT